MTNLDQNTGLPEVMTLSELFDQVEVTAAEGAALLSWLSAAHSGTAQSALANKLNQAAMRTADPAYYKDNPDYNMPTQQAEAARGDTGNQTTDR